jgi:hypothetical protein
VTSPNSSRRANAPVAAPPQTQSPTATKEPGAPAVRPELVRAPDAWQRTQRDIAAGVEQLKKAIRTEFAEEAPDLIAEIDQKLEQLDGILDNLDDRLSEALRKANAAANPSARANELGNARTILARYIGYVGSEPLIAGIDANPFGVQINLKRKLTDALTRMAVAIGR